MLVNCKYLNKLLVKYKYKYKYEYKYKFKIDIKLNSLKFYTNILLYMETNPGGISKTSSKIFTIEHAITEYLTNMNDIELMIYNLAKDQLKSSFDLEKSIGFLDYLKQNNIIIEKSLNV